MLIIRQEQRHDYKKVYQVILKAFESAKYSDGTEQELVEALRKSKAFIPELSLVAILNDKLVGHILFTIAYVDSTEVLALAPLSVLPEYQHQGVGMTLIQYGHTVAKKLGYKFSIVLGYPEYYIKAGYIPASKYGIKAPFEVDDENFMAICFDNKICQLKGTLEYDIAFNM